MRGSKLRIIELIENKNRSSMKKEVNYALGERKGFFNIDSPEFLALGDCFNRIREWIHETYNPDEKRFEYEEISR